MLLIMELSQVSSWYPILAKKKIPTMIISSWESYIASPRRQPLHVYLLRTLIHTCLFPIFTSKVGEKTLVYSQFELIAYFTSGRYLFNFHIRR